MKYILFFQFLVSVSAYAQDLNKTYICESKTFELEKKFQVNELTIKSDSTYTRTVYKLDNKMQKDIYKSFTPSIIENGVFRKDRNFYFLKPSNQDFEMGKYKINDNEIIYYRESKNNKYKKGAKFKRVK